MATLEGAGYKPLSSQQEFVAKYGPAAVAMQEKYGIPASVALAQAALESSWGSSGLAKWWNNLFGIKGKGDAGTTYLPTSEYVDGKYVAEIAGFASYSTPEASFADYGDFLKRNKRYADAFKAKTAEEAVDAIASAGYATDPEYADKVKSIIRDYNLTAFDTVATTGEIDESKATGGFWQGLMDRIKKDSKIYKDVSGEVEDIKDAFDPKPIVTASVKTLLIIALIVILAIIIIQALPIPQVQAAKGAAS